MHLPLGLMPVTRPTPGQIKRQRPGGAFPAHPDPHANPNADCYPYSHADRDREPGPNPGTLTDSTRPPTPLSIGGLVAFEDQASDLTAVGS